MKNGKHTLTFRIWDLLNNSATETIEFEVIKGLTPEIFSVHNYPNPVRLQTNISVQHDRPETILNTTLKSSICQDVKSGRSRNQQPTILHGTSQEAMDVR
jgi:hypothetical protein